MTEELIALGRRAIACKGWRWMAGMLSWVWYDDEIDRELGEPEPCGCWLGPTRVTAADDEGPLAWSYLGEEPESPNCHTRGNSGDWDPTEIPDFSDPATRGCALELVRELWGTTAHMVRLQTHDSDGNGGMVPACWWALATGLSSKPLLLDGCRYIAAPTEAEALVAALESMS